MNDKWPMVRWVDHISGQVYTEPATRDRCWKCGRENPDLAHAVLEYLAATLAEPLRQAFEAHLDEHGCGDPSRGGRGIAHCPKAMELWDLLPDGDRIVFA